MGMVLKITKVQGTPVFTTFGTDVKLAKVYGATQLENDPLWYYPAYYPLHQIVLRDFRVLRVPITISPMAQKVIAQMDSFGERIQVGALPPNFRFKTDPYQHQRDGLVHAIYHFRAALFYACGLGKTKIVIDWQRAVGVYPLILCPKVVLPVWGFEARRHGIEQEFRIVDAATVAEKTTQIEDAKNYTGMVITYKSATRYYEQIATQVPYNAIVADESHCIKAPRSQRTKVALELRKKASRRIIMSGTPSLGDPRDVYSQFIFLADCLMPEAFWKFKQQFCATSPKNKRIVIGFKNLDTLHRRVAIVTIQRKKEECLDLPYRTITDVPVDLAPAQKRVYNTLIATAEFDAIEAFMQENNLLSGDGLIDIPNGAILINKLMQVASGFLMKKPNVPNPCDTCDKMRECVLANIKPYTKQCSVVQELPVAPVERLKDNAKLDALLEKLDDVLVEPTHKCIIWAQFLEELDWLEEAIKAHWAKEKKSWTMVRVDGSTSSKISTLAETFNTDSECRVYLGQVSTGVGITLNAANYTMYFSLPWKMGDYDQSLDRNHRVGQHRNVTVYRFLARHTVDVNIARALTTKATVAETITTALVCSKCDRSDHCFLNDIQLYGEGCRYARAVRRQVTRARAIT